MTFTDPRLLEIARILATWVANIRNPDADIEEARQLTLIHFWKHPEEARSPLTVVGWNHRRTLAERLNN